jgi:curved DNA-binding protein CbpA
MKFNFNFYILLGVDNNFTEDELKKAYRKLAKKYHSDIPDTGNEDIIKKLNTAYSILKDPEKRILYDLGKWDDLEPESEINLTEAEQNIVSLLCSNLDSLDDMVGHEILKMIMVDIVSDLKKEVSDYDKKIFELEGSMDFLSKLKNTISFKGEKTKHNLINMAIEQSISLKEGGIQDIRDQIILAKEMLNIMDDFRKKPKLLSHLSDLRGASKYKAIPEFPPCWEK